jgi:co-chaperonin GroES (HSP10)
MKAFRSGVIVKQITPEARTAGGLILTQNHNTTYGLVTSVGGDVSKEVSVGDKVVVNWNNTVSIPHENDTLYILNQDSILAVVK